MKRIKTIYYNEHGQIDRVATIINSLPDWVAIAILIIGVMLGGTITGM